MRDFILGKYSLGKTIGEGAFSKVKLATVIKSGEKVAVKVIDKQMMAQIEQRAQMAQDDRERKRIVSERKKAQKELMKQRQAVESDGSENANLDLGKILQDLQKQNEELEKVTLPERVSHSSNILPNLQKEVKLLMRLDHPNVIKVFEIYDSPSFCYIIMYLAKGELMDYITTRKKLTEKEGRKFFRQIASGLAHIHAANVVHRDLKLENILLTKDMDCLITDFGLGNSFDGTSSEMKTICGTPNYASPEIVAGTPYDGVKSDIWALGVILFILCAGKRPFTGSTLAVLYQKILATNYTSPSHFSPELIELLSKILVKDFQNRISIEQICKNAWVNLGYDKYPVLLPPKEFMEIDSKFARKIKSLHNESEFTVYSINPINTKSAAITAETVEKVRTAAARKRAESVAPVQTSFGNIFASPPDKPRKISDTGLSFNRKSEANIIGVRRSSNSSYRLSNSIDRSNDMTSNPSQGSFSLSLMSSKQSIEFPTSARKRSGSFTQPLTFFTQLSSANIPQSSEPFFITEESSLDKGDEFVTAAEQAANDIKTHGSFTTKSELSVNTKMFLKVGVERKDPYSPKNRSISFQSEFFIKENGEENQSKLDKWIPRGEPQQEFLESEKSKIELQKARTSLNIKKGATETAQLVSNINTPPENLEFVTRSKVNNNQRLSFSRKGSRPQGESSLRISVTQKRDDDVAADEQSQKLECKIAETESMNLPGISKYPAVSKNALKITEKNTAITNHIRSPSDLSSSNESINSNGITSASGRARSKRLSAIAFEASIRRSSSKNIFGNSNNLSPSDIKTHDFRFAGKSSATNLNKTTILHNEHDSGKPPLTRKRANTITESTPMRYSIVVQPEIQTEELQYSVQKSMQGSHSNTSSFYGQRNSRKVSDTRLELTDVEIQSWHDTHKPAKIIRTVRFPFHRGLASFELEPARIFIDLHDVLCQISELGMENEFNFIFKRPVPDYYLFEINVDIHSSKQTMKFEAEICKLWMLKMHGVRMKRIHGDAFVFKYFHDMIVARLGYK